MFDPYKNDTPGLEDPARNIIGIEVGVDLPIGIKGLRVFNMNGQWETLNMITMTDEEVTLGYPPNSVTFEPLRIKRLTGMSMNNMLVHGYTDVETPAAP